MIIGIGNDITDMRRIEKALERFGDKFINRCFTQNEIARAAQKTSPQARISHFARRFAAKEACAKALGTGIGSGILFREIGVENDKAGKPSLTLSGRARAILESLAPEGQKAHIHLSLSDEPPLAQAFVIIETRP